MTRKIIIEVTGDTMAMETETEGEDIAVGEVLAASALLAHLAAADIDPLEPVALAAKHYAEVMARECGLSLEGEESGGEVLHA